MRIASIVQQLTNLGLVDEYHLLLQSVILGKGKPLFKVMKVRRDNAFWGPKTLGMGYS